MDRVPKGYYPMKLVSQVQQTTDMAKKLVAKKTKGKVQKKRCGQHKKVQKNKSRPKRVQKKKSIKGGKKRSVVGSFAKRKSILS